LLDGVVDGENERNNVDDDGNEIDDQLILHTCCDKADRIAITASSTIDTLNILFGLLVRTVFLCHDEC
jgi:hypothetical protein